MRLLSIPLAVLVAFSAAPVAQATFPGGNGRIAYTTKDSDYRQLVTAKPDSRGDRFLRECQLTEPDGQRGDCSIEYRDPAWSADGRRLVFDTGRALALIDADGTGFEKLEPFSADDGEPAFSPSRRQLVFSGRSATRRALFVADIAGERVRRIARNGDAPDWSRRNRIAFLRRGAIYSVRPSGKGLRRLTRGRDPSWSPSGRAIAFARGDGIYVARADGSRARRVVRCTRCSTPAYSPDGRLLAYDGGGVRVVRLRDGRRLATIAEDVAGGFDAREPSWQPL